MAVNCQSGHSPRLVLESVDVAKTHTMCLSYDALRSWGALGIVRYVERLIGITSGKKNPNFRRQYICKFLDVKNKFLDSRLNPDEPSEKMKT